MDPLQSALADFTGEECKIEDIGNNRVFEIPASSDCGTEVNNNGTHLVYSNKVQGLGRTKFRKIVHNFHISFTDCFTIHYYYLSSDVTSVQDIFVKISVKSFWNYEPIKHDMTAVNQFNFYSS